MDNHEFNQLASFERKKIILAGWKASGASDPLERGLAETVFIHLGQKKKNMKMYVKIMIIAI